VTIGGIERTLRSHRLPTRVGALEEHKPPSAVHREVWDPHSGAARIGGTPPTPPPAGEAEDGGSQPASPRQGSNIERERSNVPSKVIAPSGGGRWEQVAAAAGGGPDSGGHTCALRNDRWQALPRGARARPRSALVVSRIHGHERRARVPVERLRPDAGRIHRATGARHAGHAGPGGQSHGRRRSAHSSKERHSKGG
jgi:hypothetical protein